MNQTLSTEETTEKPEAEADCSAPTCFALPTSFAGIMDWMKTLSEKYGDEKAMKVVECLNGVTLALKCFDEDVAFDSVETLHEMLQAAKAEESSSQNA